MMRLLCIHLQIHYNKFICKYGQYLSQLIKRLQGKARSDPTDAGHGPQAGKGKHAAASQQ